MDHAHLLPGAWGPGAEQGDVATGVSEVHLSLQLGQAWMVEKVI